MNLFQRIKQHPYTTMMIFVLLGLIFLFYYYEIDGNFVNPPIVFHYDTQNIPVQYQTYHPGDTVRIMVNFCVTRPFTGGTQWALADGRLTFFPTETVKHSIPVGCYPADKSKTILVDVEKIPTDPTLINDTVHFEGVASYTLPGGRKVSYSYQTETFKVIK